MEKVITMLITPFWWTALYFRAAKRMFKTFWDKGFALGSSLPSIWNACCLVEAAWMLMEATAWSKKVDRWIKENEILEKRQIQKQGEIDGE